MNKKILLLVPPCLSVDDICKKSDAKFTMKLKKEIPLGVLSIAAYLKKFIPDIDIKILDFNLLLCKAANSDFKYETLEGWYYETLSNAAAEYDIIGISALFNTTFSHLKIISSMCKKINNHCFIFAGGGVPTNLYREVLEDAEEIDAISFGEGEIPILELFQSENKKSYIEKSKCWITREKLLEKIEYEYKFIEDLDEIPMLDFGLINFLEYNSHVHTQREELVISAPLMFSRGCPFNCCFCSSHSIHGKKVRYNSIERIKADILSMVQNYQVNTVTVWDDNFFANKENTFMLLDFFRNLNLQVEFVNGFPVYRMDDEMAIKLREAGVEVVTLAIESGNDRVLKDIIHKPHKISMVRKAIQILRKYNFYVKGLFVIGMPGETMEDIDITMEFIHDIPVNWVDIFIASPIAGSELYITCKEKGYLKEDDLNSCNYWKGNIETPEFTAKQIEDIQVFNVIKKDYVYNYDMIHGNYSRALINFEFVINAKHNNPFAFYYASIAAKKLGEHDKSLQYEKMSKEIFANNCEWNELAEKFKLLQCF